MRRLREGLKAPLNWALWLMNCLLRRFIGAANANRRNNYIAGFAPGKGSAKVCNVPLRTQDILLHMACLRTNLELISPREVEGVYSYVS